MLSRNALFLSILFVSVSAANIAPLLAIRQTNTPCQTQCSQVINQVQSGTCDVQCICTASVINAIGLCVQCAESEGINIPGLGSNYVQTLETDCTNAGYPVSGVSTGGSSSSSTIGSGLSGTGLGSGESTTAAAATATGGLGGLGGATTTAAATKSTSSSGSGITFGKSSATGLTAQLGAVAAAVAGVIILAA